MGVLETLLLSAGLAMDAVAVAMTNGMAYRNLKLKHYIAMPLFFGIFQGLMPLAGFFAGSCFSEILEKYAGIVILLILGIIGGKMVYEGLRPGGHDELKGCLTVPVLFFQAIATSIDAFAVGVAFAAMRVDIVFTVSMIAVVTGLLVGAAIYIGKKAGNILGSKAEILGGIILIIIGIKGML